MIEQLTSFKSEYSPPNQRQTWLLIDNFLALHRSPKCYLWQLSRNILYICHAFTANSHFEQSNRRCLCQKKPWKDWLNRRAKWIWSRGNRVAFSSTSWWSSCRLRVWWGLRMTPCLIFFGWVLAKSWILCVVLVSSSHDRSEYFHFHQNQQTLKTYVRAQTEAENSVWFVIPGRISSSLMIHHAKSLDEIASFPPTGIIWESRVKLCTLFDLDRDQKSQQLSWVLFQTPPYLPGHWFSSQMKTS